MITNENDNNVKKTFIIVWTAQISIHKTALSIHYVSRTIVCIFIITLIIIRLSEMTKLFEMWIDYDGNTPVNCCSFKKRRDVKSALPVRRSDRQNLSQFYVCSIRQIPALIQLWRSKTKSPILALVNLTKIILWGHDIKINKPTILMRLELFLG